jgi:outer membrane immunogenic protein
MEQFMKHLATALLIGAACIATPALAQDSNSTFTGPRIEGIIGYDMSRAGSSVDNDTTRSDDESIDGLLYGVGAGFDFAVGGAVVGVEGEWTMGTAKTDFARTDPNNFGLGRVSTGRDLYLGGRLGFLAGPKTLIYVKGGYTNARYNLLGTDGVTELNGDYSTDGWRAGAGVEVALSEHTFAKVEYRYSKYSEAEIDFEGAAPSSPRFNIDTDRHQVAASFGFRF